MVYGVGSVVNGVWCTECGVWCMVYGVWCMVYGVWSTVCGVWCMVNGLGCMATFACQPGSQNPPPASTLGTCFRCEGLGSEVFNIQFTE